jgi:hypothetical protein
MLTLRRGDLAATRVTNFEKNDVRQQLAGFLKLTLASGGGLLLERSEMASRVL